MTAKRVFDGNNGAATRAYLAGLSARGPNGQLAAMLFRAQKASIRAKAYTGSTVDRYGRNRSYRSLAYDKKNWALSHLVDMLMRLPWPPGEWGWGLDPAQTQCPHVLYVDLPVGQVSFHSSGRLDGPTYPGKWDGRRGVGSDRIIAFCDQVMGEVTLPAPF
jgi:hypothetical protein